MEFLADSGSYEAELVKEIHNAKFTPAELGEEERARNDSVVDTGV